MISRRNFFIGTIAVAATGAASDAFAQTTKCLLVNPVDGTREPLTIAEITPERATARSIPATWRSTAMEIIAVFESGSPDLQGAYGNVSATDVLSLGFLQWNHNTGSLYDTLLKNADPSMIDSAPESIRDDVRKLCGVNTGALTKRGASQIIGRWKEDRGRLKPSAKKHVQTWLLSDPMKKRQDELVDRRLISALQLSDAWQRDIGKPLAGSGAQRAFLSFVDVEVFNGNLAGLWAPHVTAFRSSFENDAAMLDQIADWVSGCVVYRFDGQAESKGDLYTPEYRKLYWRSETQMSVADWKSLAAANDPRIDDAALNLLALGYLRARRSNGNDAPRGFAGVFQLDVLNRRGMMATGRGVLPSQKTITVLYTL